MLILRFIWTAVTLTCNLREFDRGIIQLVPSMLTRMIAFALLLPTFCLAQSDDSPSKNVEFKIHNEVFVGGRSLAASSNLTLFQDRRVFDFRYLEGGTKIGEIAIFDAQDRSFVLLDVERKLRLEIDNIQLLRILEGMRNELKNSPKVAHQLFDDATEEFDAAANSIRVGNSRIKYDVVGKRPEEDQLLAAYLRFLENYTLLGATDPLRMPPFARIKLNRSIKKFGIMPESVSLKIFDQDGVSIEVAAKSQHKLETELSSQDRQLISLARQYWMEFEQVGIARYRSIEFADSQSKPESSEP